MSAALAAVGHHLATESPVPYGPLSFATAALFLAVLPWVGRIRCLPGAVGGTLTGQVLLHRVQALCGHHDGAMLGMPGHRDAHGTLLMLAAHALAAVAVALLLHGADRRLSALPSVLVRLLRSLAAVLARLLTWCLFRPAHGAGPYGPRAPQTAPVAGLGTALLAHSLVRRGPPVWQ
ncbi:hypothetical protein [Actinacidiphila oryziradicis]|uniref:Uncharacterized protein n=1 Tax=Actinacidiphila oryziradicis TaxID=2571141 RepID=A0A4U0RHG6_9ACTN|nr:hypothetical protein [Actinacidiphila oryziradicis]TJZ95039.1 hypothetical protein FCI23_52680 [Actinacidiphila oryziradicis]